MTFDEILPAIIVIGYGVAIALGAGGSTLRKRARRHAVQMPSTDAPPVPPWGGAPPRQFPAMPPEHARSSPAGQPPFAQPSPAPTAPPAQGWAGPVPPHSPQGVPGPAGSGWAHPLPPQGAPAPPHAQHQPAPTRWQAPTGTTGTEGTKGTEDFEDFEDATAQAIESPPGPPYRTGTTLLTLGWLVGIAITFLWIAESIGFWGFMTILAMLVVLPSVIVLVASALSRAHEEGRKASAPARVMGALFAGCLFVVGLGMLINGLSYEMGFAQRIDVHITAVKDGVVHTSKNSRGKRRSYYDPNLHVSGRYVVDGEQHTITNHRWHGDVPPEPGDVVGGLRAPLLPHRAILDNKPSVEILEFLVSGGAFAGGGAVLYFSLRRPRKKDGGEPASTDNTITQNEGA